jgi:hypothetical protein
MPDFFAQTLDFSCYRAVLSHEHSVPTPSVNCGGYYTMAV